MMYVKTPMTLSKLKKKRAAILRLGKRYGAANFRVFGSVVRGEAKKNSDVDFLVRLKHGRSLLDLAGLTIDLRSLLGRKVDVVTEDCLHWYIRDRILQEAQPL